MKTRIIKALLTPARIARFEARVQRGPDCWPWQGRRNPVGYGVFDGPNGLWLAHRVALTLALDRELTAHVLHACHNPCCCNPAHLREGTAQDNLDDMVAAGRDRFDGMRGRREDNHPRQRYNKAMRAEAIRLRFEERWAQDAIAAHLGVHRQTVMRWLHAHSGKNSRTLRRSRPTIGPNSP